MDEKVVMLCKGHWVTFYRSFLHLSFFYCQQIFFLQSNNKTNTFYKTLKISRYLLEPNTEHCVWSCYCLTRQTIMRTRNYLEAMWEPPGVWAQFQDVNILYCPIVSKCSGLCLFSPRLQMCSVPALNGPKYCPVTRLGTLLALMSHICYF